MIPKQAYLLAKGRKWPVIQVRYSDGSAKAFTVRADLDTAQDVLKEVRRAIAFKRFNLSDYVIEQASQITLAEFSELYLRERESLVETGQISRNTWEADKYSFKIFFKCVEPDKKFQDTAESDVQNFVKFLLRQEYSRNSVNDYCRHLKGAFSWAQKREMLKKSPFHNFRKLEVVKQKRSLSPENLKKLLDYFAGLDQSWPYDAAILAVFTGIRRETILTLKAENITRKTIDGEERWFLKTTEKGRKDREVYLVPHARKVIERRLALLQNQTETRRIIERKKRPGDSRRYQERISQGFLFWEILLLQTVSKIYAQARRAVGIPGTWHSLRHTAATYMRHCGVPLDTIKVILGHSETVMSELYADMTLEKMATDMKKFELFEVN